MSEILLKASDARDHAASVKSAASTAVQDFNSLKSKLSALKDSFRGKSSDAFEGRYEEWHKSAEQLIEALDGLGQFLDKAAQTIEETDTTLASQLGS